MLHIPKKAMLAWLVLSMLAVNIGYASDLQSLNVSLYLNGTLLHGQRILQLQNQSQAEWKIYAVFSGLKQNISAVLNQSAINYTDSSGTTSTSQNPLLINWTANPELATYPLNLSLAKPVYTLSSNITLGSVSQMGLYSNATAAPACHPNQLYTEWDFQVTVKQNYFQSSRNVVVGRVCFYNDPEGYSYALPKNSINQLSSSLILTSGIRQENLILNYNSTYARSSDGLVQASWPASHVYSIATPPNGSGYVAINDTSNNQWYIHNNATYSKWYKQYYSFAQNFIPKQILFYSPTNIGILSNNCNVVSTSNLTNNSVNRAVQCMNSTAVIYYSLANTYAMQLLSSSQNVSGYPASEAPYRGSPAVVVSLPSEFILQPKLDLNLSGAFLGIATPAGKPAIISVSSTSLNSLGIGSVISQIENVGNSPALFSISIANCPGIFTPSGISYQLSQGEGEEISTAIVSSNSSQIINQQCTVIVTDISGWGSASAPVTITSGPGQRILNAIRNFFRSL